MGRVARTLIAAALTCNALSAPVLARDGNDPRAGAAATADSAPVDTGVASYYADRFAGNRTAAGERYDPDALTAAHRTLPLGARVRVTDLVTGREVIVRINDRGPHSPGRVIDLSRAAARELGLIRRGVGRVALRLVEAAND